jgi:hypothetical protein
MEDYYFSMMMTLILILNSRFVNGHMTYKASMPHFRDIIKEMLDFGNQLENQDKGS